ncbi:hypothetical protein G6L37_00170 [Agrobacterium rubi]|nr:hypothetical protein [Agrobacterium rubi]NTF23665.1 hypothetical protein [Agrobacterium rubi]
MGEYSTHFWGIDLTTTYDRIEEAMPSLDPESESEPLDGIYGLGDYIVHHGMGRSLYDGGGYGQITFIGKNVPSGPRGITVTDELVAEVAALIETIPEELKAAIILVHGQIREPAFYTKEGWG